MKKITRLRITDPKIQYFIVGILASVSVILGILLIKDYVPNLQTFFQKNTVQRQNQAQIDTSFQEKKPKEATTSSRRRPLPSNLTDEERLLLTPPAPDAPKEEKNKHLALVEKLAKESEFLELNACNGPEPLDLKLIEGADFKVRNSDKIDHTIVINKDYNFKIPAGQIVTFKADFPYGKGAYGYLCDSEPGVVGFFLVVPN